MSIVTPDQHRDPALAAAPVPATTRPAAAVRLDLYAGIHKTLRLFMTDTLTRVGRLDVADAAELAAVLHQVDDLLLACRHHLAHENQHVHTALESRRPGSTQRVAAEHEEHLDAIAALGADAAALQAMPSAGAAHRLYRHLALFVGENLVHMNVEETAHNAALWDLYGDDELMALHQRILASIDPAEMAATLHWMLPALTPAERAELLGGMQQQLPPEGLRQVLDIARAVLDDGAWAKLARAMNLPPVPGLVQA